MDPILELVRAAMANGVMMALEGREQLLAKLQALPASGTLGDALTADAESFIRIRADLIEAVTH